MNPPSYYFTMNETARSAGQTQNGTEADSTDRVSLSNRRWWQAENVRTRAFSLVALLLTSLGTGCLPNKAVVHRVEVHGQLTLDGEPIADARIVCIPIHPITRERRDRPLAEGLTDSQGKFSLRSLGQPGAVSGWHYLLVSKRVPQQDSTPPVDPQITSRDPVEAPRLEQFERDDELFPAYYNYQTRLRFRVPEQGPAQIDLNLSILDLPIKK